ncbi:MAG: hypothetical protein ACPL08_04695 [Dictyoglomus turgidum]
MSMSLERRISIFFLILFMVPFLILLSIEGKLLKNESLYPLFYQIAEILSLIIAIYYFSKIGRVWRGWLGWLFVVLSLVLLFIADSIWNFYAIFKGEEAPFPGISDIFYMLFYVFAFVFLIYFIRLLRLEFDASEKFLILLISLLFLVLLVQGILIPVLRSQEMTILSKILNIFYIVGDFILIILAFMLIVKLWGGKVAKNYSYFILAISLTTIADILFVYIFRDYGISNWADIFYLASFLLLAYSIVRESLLHISK